MKSDILSKRINTFFLFLSYMDPPFKTNFREHEKNLTGDLLSIQARRLSVDKSISQKVLNMFRMEIQTIFDPWREISQIPKIFNSEEFIA